MSPAKQRVVSLTKFYRLSALVRELAQVSPGMTASQARTLLGAGHKELADDVVLYSGGLVIDDPLLQACRARSSGARVLLLVALIMADHRIARITENYLTDKRGKLVPGRFHTDKVERALLTTLKVSAARKPATNILSYFRDSGMVRAATRGKTIVGIDATSSARVYVADIVRYVIFRLQHLGADYPLGDDDVETVLAMKANHWVNLTRDEFRGAYHSNVAKISERSLPPSPRRARRAPPVASHVPVAAVNTESFEVSGQSARIAVQREQPLVLAYKNWMEARGSKIVRLKIRPPGSAVHLFCDLYDKTRNNLIESKNDTSRPAIRMAIGQLMDYRRFAQPSTRMALLTSTSLGGDLEALLRTLGIASIWPYGKTFVDNADGVFV